MKNASDDKAYAALMKKYKEAIKKKKYYKTQCKIANENISNIIKKLKNYSKRRGYKKWIEQFDVAKKQTIEVSLLL